MCKLCCVTLPARDNNLKNKSLKFDDVKLCYDGCD
jgi:hypothetical protein